MPVSYLSEKPWVDWSREERFFCFELYAMAKLGAGKFAEWLISASGLNGISQSDKWDIGVEVCFYRDFLWHNGLSAAKEGFSRKRTFDLCLFSERSIIVVEAKVFGRFDMDTCKVFEKDRFFIKKLLKRDDLSVYLVALASSRYFKNAQRYGNKDTLAIFDGQLSWHDAFLQYKNPLFNQADDLYKAKVSPITLNPVHVK
jgi:hypothetical protein